MVACSPKNSAGAHLKHRIIEMVLYLITCLRHRSARHTRHAPGVSHLVSQVATVCVWAKMWRSEMEQEMQSYDPEKFIRGLRISAGSCNAMELLIPAVFTYWPHEVLCHRMDSNVVLVLCSATWVFAMPWFK